MTNCPRCASSNTLVPNQAAPADRMCGDCGKVWRVAKTAPWPRDVTLHDLLLWEMLEREREYA